MRNTFQTSVPATFKPSGGIVTQPTAEPVEPSPVVPNAEPQPITYALRTGGVLVETCPSWCVLDHASDIEGIYAEDLVHEGAEIQLRTNTIEGSRVSILAAQIMQWPFSTDGNGSEAPYMALRPEASMGESLGYSTPEDVEAEIRRAEAHLGALRALNARLVDARAEYEHRRGLRPENLTADDVRSLPVPVLLRAFGLKVVEFGEMPHGVQVWLDRTGSEPAVYLLRSLPQSARESLVRECLTAAVEARG
ncbi:hypothetical protein GTY83_19020 [Streptomyces sp. SID4928]|uniref:DUF6907 domain-containing protein n=1 Tax=unclassified Streptomyces TaxID=2593676 RepID=UPI0001C1A58D|nr:hypothetical protein [Streptomyces sp. ACT-1]EGE43166.1 hypothetical protein SACT1_3833 [Streptomyces sp. ACT-1]MYR51202.1 hypothetical protein [Streptomyces sp. SID4928]